MFVSANAVIRNAVGKVRGKQSQPPAAPHNSQYMMEEDFTVSAANDSHAILNLSSDEEITRSDSVSLLVCVNHSVYH